MVQTTNQNEHVNVNDTVNGTVTVKKKIIIIEIPQIKICSITNPFCFYLWK
jgi:hypothetical protein